MGIVEQIAKIDKNETDPFLQISRDCHWYNPLFFMICHHGWVHVHPQAQETQYLSLSVPSFPGKALGLQFFRTSFMPHVKKKSEGVSVIIYFACGPGRLQREDCVEAARLGSEFRCGINSGRVRVISQEVGCATN